MPREKRLVVVGTPHHITQRGNNRQAVFRFDADPTPRAFRRLRQAIRSGTPYGDHAFVSSLEQRFARRLVPSKPGPKRAQATAAATL